MCKSGDEYYPFNDVHRHWKWAVPIYTLGDVTWNSAKAENEEYVCLQGGAKTCACVEGVLREDFRK